MPGKLNDDIIDVRLVGRNIKRLSPYEGSTKDMHFECEVCQFDWWAIPRNVATLNIKGHGCKRCSRNQFTNEIIDELLKDRPIERISDYCGNKKGPLWVRCKDCNREWETDAEHLICRKQGCRQCKGLLKLTNEKLDEDLNNRSIKRMGNCEGSHKPTDFQCIECNYLWTALPFHIKRGSGCPRCSNTLPLTNEEVDKRLNSRPIKRLSDFIHSKQHMQFLCLLCNKDWWTLFSNVDRGSGCPYCFGHIKLTNAIVDERLLGRMIQRIGDHINAATPIEWLCLVCSNHWLATSNDILNRHRGCPICAIPGQNEKLLCLTLRTFSEPFEHDYNIQKINNSTPYGYRLDAYYPKFSFAIEYNGKQHYEPSNWGVLSSEEAVQQLIKQQERDKYVDQFCKDNNITLIWIDGREYYGKKLKEYINNTIISMLLELQKKAIT